MSSGSHGAEGRERRVACAACLAPATFAPLTTRTAEARALQAAVRHAQVAEVVAGAIVNRELAANKVLEVTAEEGVEEADIAELLAAVPQVRRLACCASPCRQRHLAVLVAPGVSEASHVATACVSTCDHVLGTRKV